jgi:hypothetical protein
MARFCECSVDDGLGFKKFECKYWVFFKKIENFINNLISVKFAKVLQ